MMGVLGRRVLPDPCDIISMGRRALPVGWGTAVLQHRSASLGMVF
jgi:hypothetical protein